MSATGNFQSPRTSSLAFEMAGILLRNGARRESLKAPREDFRDPRSFGQARPTRPFGQPRQQPGVQPNYDQRIQNQQRPTTEFPREQRKNDQNSDEAPSDWLAPKIFKGSTNVE